MEASPRPVPPIISSKVNALQHASAGRNDSKGDTCGAIEMPMATFVAEENINVSVVTFPHKILRSLLVSDGVTAYAQIVRFLFMFMAEFDDFPVPVIMLSSLTSLLSLLLACTMHGKASIREDKLSTNRIMWIHITIFIMETIIALVMLAFVTAGSASIAFVLMAPILTLLAIFVFPFVALGLNMVCYMLETRLQNKIKSADIEVIAEHVESSVAQALIEEDGIEVV